MWPRLRCVIYIILFFFSTYRAADWKLDSPDWVSRLKVMALGKKCYICIEDKNSGDLFAKAPVESYPGEAVEAVLDSSRYFVIRVEDESGRLTPCEHDFRNKY